MRQYGYHRRMVRILRVVPWLIVACGLVGASACRRTDAAPPVATVSLALSKTSVALGGVIDLTYRFEVSPDARIDGDYLVFVHLNREDGTTIWNDDHPLPAGLRTSEWRPGQVVEYTRTRFVPTFSYIGPATIEVGLYRDDERLPLRGPNPGDRENPARSYQVATLDLLPQSERVQTYRLSGWYPPEFAPDDPSIEWQWTQKTATLSLRNPKRDLTLFIEYDALGGAPGEAPQQVSVYCGDAKLLSFAAEARQPTPVRIPVSASQLGSGEMVELRLELDRTYVPARLEGAGGDTRELGIRVFHVDVEPR
jgi:hypothetical protein